MLKTILIVDGNNAAWRLMRRLPVLTTVQGQPTQVVYGMLRLLHGVLDQFMPDIALVCWDSGHSAARKKIYPLYKARYGLQDKDHDKTEKNLYTQIRVLKRVLDMANVAQLTYPDTEADDLIAFSCKELHQYKKIIVSTDRDMYQLIEPYTQVWSPGKLELFTDKNFREKIGLSPEQYLHMRAMTGDTTDNIPGVAKGCGEVTVQELLLKYGSIGKILCPSTEKKMLAQGGRQALLCAEGVKEIADRNLRLMDLRFIAQSLKDVDDIRRMLYSTLKKRRKVNKVELLTYFKENEFKSLQKDMPTWLQPFEHLDTE